MGKFHGWAAGIACSAALASGASAATIQGNGDPAAHPGVIAAITQTFEGIPTTPDDSHGSLTLDGVTFTGYDRRGIAGPVGISAPLHVNDRYPIYTVADAGAGPFPGYTTDGTYHYYLTDGKYNSTGQSLSNGHEPLNYSGSDPLPYVTQFRFDFESPVEFFAFNLGALDNTWTLTTFGADDGLLDTLVIGPQPFASSGEYYGASDADGISYALLTSSLGAGQAWGQGEMILIDNFVTGGLISGRNAVVPVPAGLPMLMGALGAFGLAGWRWKRDAA